MELKFRKYGRMSWKIRVDGIETKKGRVIQRTAGWTKANEASVPQMSLNIHPREHKQSAKLA